LTVSGWDMSYFTSSFPIVGSNFTGPYAANWSDLDDAGVPQIGVNNSQAFGQARWDGTQGSTNEIPTGSGDQLFVTTGNLGSNRFTPAGGTMDSTAHASLVTDGGGLQTSAAEQKLLLQDVMSIVFSGDLSSISSTGNNWSVQFAAKTNLLTQSTELTVDYSTDGGLNYSGATVIAVDDVDSLKTASFAGADGASGILVRISTTDGIDVDLDNVTILADIAAVPEPAVALMGMFGTLGLVAFGRKRA
jgi:hypothetical protein